MHCQLHPTDTLFGSGFASCILHPASCNHAEKTNQFWVRFCILHPAAPHTSHYGRHNILGWVLHSPLVNHSAFCICILHIQRNTECRISPSMQRLIHAVADCNLHATRVACRPPIPPPRTPRERSGLLHNHMTMWLLHVHVHAHVHVVTPRLSLPLQLSSVKAAAPRCGRAGGAAAMRTSPKPSRQRRPVVRGGRPGACLRLLLPATRSLAPLLGGGGRVGRPRVVQPAVGGRSAQAGGSDALVQSFADVEARAEQRGRLERRALHLADACSLRVRTGCRSTSRAVARSVSRGCVVRAAPAPPGWR